MGTVEYRPVTFSSGNGPWLYVYHDGETKTDYLDFFCDVGTSSLGYGGKEQQDVISRMYHLPAHAPNIFGFDERDRAARRLCEMTQMDRVFFCNSGAESVEAAIKLARLWSYKKGCGADHIYSYVGGFHGRTYGALSAGDGAPYHYEGFGKMLDGVFHFKEAWEITDPETCAIILAPCFGNNDIREYPDGWLKDLREFCDNNGILLIFDEVQTGSGRTGMMTYAQRCGVKPDIMTLAKGIGMGAPVGAMLASADIAEVFTPGTHFSTFGGNPLSCAFVNGMLDWLERPGNLESVNRKGEFIKETLQRFGWAKNIRGPGMLIGFDIDIDTSEFAARCLENQLLIGAFRKGPGAVKISPPLNIEKEDIIKGLTILDESYKELING